MYVGLGLFSIYYMFIFFIIFCFNYKFLLYAKVNVLNVMEWIIRFLGLKIGVLFLFYIDLNNKVLKIREEFYFIINWVFCFLVI